MKAWLVQLWALIKARSRTTIGSAVAFLAVAVPLVADQIPAVASFVAAVPIPEATRSRIQTALAVAGAGLALWQKVYDSLKGRAANWRLDQTERV